MKAVSLFSGGLDSLLAVKIIQLHGIEVVPVIFNSHFFNSEKAEYYAGVSNLDLIIRDISHKHFEIVLKPEYGYGKGMNPCIDCHALMIKEAFQVMQEIGGEFIITGDVLGQRPFSQTKKGLNLIDGLTKLGHITLRPLSAKLLEITLPEKKSIIDREKLYGFYGRSREHQLRLAKEFGVEEFETPAGGCILTDEFFSKRLNIALKQCGFDESLIDLIRVGRFFRLNKFLFIVSRNQQEGELLSRCQTGLCELIDKKGPNGRLFKCSEVGSIQSDVQVDDDFILAAKILARYAGEGPATIKMSDGKIITVEPLDRVEVERLLIR